MILSLSLFQHLKMNKGSKESLWCYSILVQLMELQSRFGTDERFRMDSRFLEDEDEEDNKAVSGVATYLDFVWMCACVVELMMELLLMELLTPINNGSSSINMKWNHWASFPLEQTDSLISATQKGKGTLRRKKRFWKMKRWEPCPSCRASSEAANKPAATNPPARPRPLSQLPIIMHNIHMLSLCFSLQE